MFNVSAVMGADYHAALAQSPGLMARDSVLIVLINKFESLSKIIEIKVSKGHYVRILLCDRGLGIPDENIAEIFDPYYSTKVTYSQKGLGLGLAVCYSVIKKHDGLIAVESEVGKGTTFHVYLPGQAKIYRCLWMVNMPKFNL